MDNLPTVGSDTSVHMFLRSCDEEKFAAIIKYCKNLVAGKYSVDRFAATALSNLPSSFTEFAIPNYTPYPKNPA